MFRNIFFTLFCFCSITPNTFATQEDLRKKIFTDQSHKSECRSVPYKVKEKTTELDKDLDIFIKDLVSAVQNAKASDLLRFFHPRLAVTLPAIDNIVASEKNTLGLPFEANVFKLFALNTVDGSPGALHCANDNISIWPQYGYPLQFGLWIQVMGQKELGRVYATIVNTDNKWWIGAFHYHQWTHQSKDYEQWFQEGMAESKNNLKEIAYIKYDIAAKLLDGKKEFHIPTKEQIINFKNNTLEEKIFDENVKKLLADWKIIYTNTIFAVDGIGIGVRIGTEKELSGKELENTCKDIGKKLLSTKEFGNLDGLRCGYVTKNEPQDKDGYLGGLYLNLKTLNKK